MTEPSPTITPNQLREAIRKQEFTKSTSGYCPGNIQANVVILPKSLASDFKEFCEKNSQACPLLEMLEAGETQPCKLVDAGKHFCDIRTDLPQYRIFRNGVFEKDVYDISDLWTDEFVTFFLGCSFSFEQALQRGGIEIRNISEGKNVSMYKTNRQCISVGPFHCPLVVSMRPVRNDLVQKAIHITEQFTHTHGAPVHCGDPSEIGISDLSKVDFGEAVTVNYETETPCFWACGVTSSLAAFSASMYIH
jgi:uncharacterized protein YcsI (UPF0317 family)